MPVPTSSPAVQPLGPNGTLVLLNPPQSLAEDHQHQQGTHIVPRHRQVRFADQRTTENTPPTDLTAGTKRKVSCESDAADGRERRQWLSLTPAPEV